MRFWEKYLDFDRILLDFAQKSSFDHKYLRFFYWFRTRSSRFWPKSFQKFDKMSIKIFNIRTKRLEKYDQIFENLSNSFKKCERNLCDISPKITKFDPNIEILIQFLEKFDQNLQIFDEKIIVIKILIILVKISNILFKKSEILVKISNTISYNFCSESR